MIPDFAPPVGHGYEEYQLKMLYHNHATAELTDNQHVLELARNLHGYARELLILLESGNEVSSLDFKRYFHTMYGYIVKLTMWRQYYFNDFQPIALGKDRKRRRYAPLMERLKVEQRDN